MATEIQNIPVTQYVGPRVVPHLWNPIDWDASTQYDALAIVQHEGNTYISRYIVPPQVDIDNTEYWVRFAAWNAQVEQYIQTVMTFDGRIENVEDALPVGDFDGTTVKAVIDAANEKIVALENTLPFSDFSADNTVKDYVDSKTSDIGAIVPSSYFSADNTVKDYVDSKVCYVTPEEFGAVGDGVTDDTNAFVTMFNSLSGRRGIVLLARNKTYHAHPYVTVDNVTIIGNGATIDGKENHCLVLNDGSHDVIIYNCNFNCDYNIETSTLSNACVAVSTNDVSAEYSCWNIKISNCNMNAGVFGIAFDNSANVIVEKCNFYNGYYVPSDSAGGYFILEQNSKNVDIVDCNFYFGTYSRHAIYVSVNQTASVKKSQNIRIVNCLFDQSKMALINGVRYSPNTPVIMVRSCNNLEITNCYAKNITGFVSTDSTEGVISNVKIDNITIDGFIYFSTAAAPSESRYIISLVGSAANRLRNAVISNIHQIYDSVANNQSFAISRAFNVEMYNVTLANYLELSYSHVHIHDIQLTKQSQIRLIGDDPITGKIEHLRGGSYAIFDSYSNGSIDPYALSPEMISCIYFTADGQPRYLRSIPYVNYETEISGNDFVIKFPYINSNDAAFLQAVPRSPSTWGGVNYGSWSTTERSVKLETYNSTGKVAIYSYQLSFNV